jgi:hypothetical protein
VSVGTEIEAVFGTFFEANFKLWLLSLGHTEQSIQLTIVTDFEVHNRSYNSMDLAWKSRQILGLF